MSWYFGICCTLLKMCGQITAEGCTRYCICKLHWNFTQSLSVSSGFVTVGAKSIVHSAQSTQHSPLSIVLIILILQNFCFPFRFCVSHGLSAGSPGPMTSLASLQSLWMVGLARCALVSFSTCPGTGVCPTVCHSSVSADYILRLYLNICEISSWSRFVEVSKVED